METPLVIDQNLLDNSTHGQVLRLAKICGVKLSRGMKGPDVKALILSSIYPEAEEEVFELAAVEETPKTEISKAAADAANAGVPIGTLNVGETFLFKTKKTICTITAKTETHVSISTEFGKCWNQKLEKLVLKY